MLKELLIELLITFGGVFLIVFILCLLYVIHLDRQGLELEKRVRKRRRTYDDGLGKYTVNITDEEWVIVPKNKKYK